MSESRMQRTGNWHWKPPVVTVFEQELSDHTSVAALNPTANAALLSAAQRLALEHHDVAHRKLDGGGRQHEEILRRERGRQPARAYPTSGFQSRSREARGGGAPTFLASHPARDPDTRIFNPDVESVVTLCPYRSPVRSPHGHYGKYPPSVTVPGPTPTNTCRSDAVFVSTFS